MNYCKSPIAAARWWIYISRNYSASENSKHCLVCLPITSKEVASYNPVSRHYIEKTKRVYFTENTPERAKTTLR